MSQFSSSVTIGRSANAVFSFVSDPQNMSQFLPTLQEAHAEAGDKISMEGEAEGQPYKSKGDLKVEPDSRKMSWGSDARHKYRGELHVEGDERQCNVSVHLTFEPGEKMQGAVSHERPDADQRIQKSLDESLECVKSICESRNS